MGNIQNNLCGVDGTHSAVSMRKRAFSLIELLAVIAILAVLAAILFPAFVAAREKDHQAACAANLKQLGLAYDQYTHDNDGRFPGVAHPDAGWAYPLYSYVKSKPAYQCPDDPKTAAPPPGRDAYISYGQNVNFNDVIDSSSGGVDETFGRQIKPVAMSEITSPSVTVALFEMTGNVMGMTGDDGASEEGNGYYGPDYFGANATGPLGGRPSPKNPATAKPQHAAGSNFLAVDGHVAFLPGSKVSNGYTPANSTDPQGQHGVAGSLYTAAGSSNLSDASGTKFTLTFSTK